MTAAERARQINEETELRVVAAGLTGWGSLVTDEEHWSGAGINTGDELDAYLAFSEFVDSYKDTYGIKPRWMSWTDKTAAEWIEGISDLRGVRDDLAEVIDTERERSQTDYEALLDSNAAEEDAFDKMDLLQENLEGIRPQRASQIG